MSSHWTVIFNPAAASKRAQRHWKKVYQILKEEEIPFEFHETQAPRHAIKLTQEAISRGDRKIIAVGGDGTLNEIATGILSQEKVDPLDIKLGQIPIGTGNDWGRTMGIPSDYRAAVKVIREEKTFIQDVGVVSFKEEGKRSQRYFINMAGMGFDAFVGINANTRKAKGRGGAFGYVGVLLKSLIRYQATPTRWYVDGESHESKVFSLVVAIGKYSGGGMMQAPPAIPDDGLLDMTVIKDLSKWTVVRNIRNLFTGTFVKNKAVVQFTGTEIRVASQPANLLEVDGDNIGTGPAEFSILPKALQVVVR